MSRHLDSHTQSLVLWVDDALSISLPVLYISAGIDGPFIVMIYPTVMARINSGDGTGSLDGVMCGSGGGTVSSGGGDGGGKGALFIVLMTMTTQQNVSVINYKISSRPFPLHRRMSHYKLIKAALGCSCIQVDDAVGGWRRRQRKQEEQQKRFVLKSTTSSSS